MIKRKRICEENYVNLIHEFRGLKVMLDCDLANLYGTDTAMINRSRRRNGDRFPEDFAFQLTEEEQSSIPTWYANLAYQNENPDQNKRGCGGGNRYTSWVYTEQGVNMLATCLHTDTAIQCSIKLMRAFSSMRQRLREIASTSNFNIPKTLSAALLLAAEQARLVEQQQQQLTFQKPKVEIYDRLIDATGLFDWCKVAKTVGTGRNKLTKFLRDKKILMSGSRQNVPYQNYVDDGLFVTKVVIIPMGKEKLEDDIIERSKTQTFTTTKGLAYIERLWRDHA